MQDTMTDQAIAVALGKYIKHHRLQQNKTQTQIAKAAQISRSTLSLLERGQTVTLSTFIRVLRVLGQLHALQTFEVQQRPSPIALAKLERQQRQRASKDGTANEPNSISW